MEHLILNDGSDSAALAKVALKALREARSSKTSNSGSIFVSDGQTDEDGVALGTGTIINGVNGGVQPWVGDTTPPGKPTGITAESHNGAIWVSWDGTLEGGIPADFDHVQFTAVDGSKKVDMGQLKAAGKVTAAELTAGDEVVVTAVAFDDAHDEHGNSTPNASPISDAVPVIVQSAVDAGEVEKAQSDAQNALNQAGQAVDTATDAKQTAQGAQTDAANAVATANSANDTSKTASTTATNALAAAQSAQQDTVTQWVPQYAVNQSTTDAPTTGWSTAQPAWTAGHYIWMRTVVGYGSGDNEYSNPVLLTGNPGATGPAGTNGSDGVSVTAITPYWALGTSAPAQPAVAAPPSPWQSTEPGYSRNQHLYKTSKVAYSNGQFAYTPVVMDSSYEYSAAAETAAQDAVQTATNANTTAKTAKSTADSAVSTANAASSTASTAKSTAYTASSVATQANATAVSANQSATSAQTAANLALKNSQELLADPTFTQQWGKWVNKNAAHAYVWFDPDNGDLVLNPTLDTSQRAVLVATPNLSGTTPVGHDRTYRISCDVRALWGGTDSIFYVSPANGMNLLIPTSGLSQTDYTHFEKDFTLKANMVLDANTIIAINVPDDAGIALRNIHVRDITEAQAAQKAADDAQSTADKAQVAADNAKALANAAQAVAQGAQTTADGKNKIFSSASEPSHAGIVPGDMWFQLDANKNVTGIKVWNGSAFTDMVLLANKLLVASSVGTTQIADNAITTGKIGANAVTALQIAAKSITGDKLDVGSVAAAIVTSGKFRTSEHVGNPSYKFAWTGTANASTSTLSHDGAVVATNYVPNPGFETGDLTGWNQYDTSAVVNIEQQGDIVPALSSGGKWQATIPDGGGIELPVPVAGAFHIGFMAYSANSSRSVSVVANGNVIKTFHPASGSWVRCDVDTPNLTPSMTLALVVSSPDSWPIRVDNVIMCTAADWQAMQALGIDWFDGDSDGDGSGVIVDSSGVRAYDASGERTFQIDATTGKATMVGGMATATSGNRVKIDTHTWAGTTVGGITGMKNDDVLWYLWGNTSDDIPGCKIMNIGLSNTTSNISLIGDGTNNDVAIGASGTGSVYIESDSYKINGRELAGKGRCVFNWENAWTGTSNSGNGYLIQSGSITLPTGWYYVEAYARLSAGAVEYHIDMDVFNADGSLADRWYNNMPIPARGIGNMVTGSVIYVDSGDQTQAYKTYTYKLYVRDYGSKPIISAGSGAKTSLFYTSSGTKSYLGRYFRIFAM